MVPRAKSSRVSAGSQLKIGSMVRVKWMMGKEVHPSERASRGKYFSAMVTERHEDGTYDVVFEDRSVETGVSACNIQRLQTEEELSLQMHEDIVRFHGEAELPVSVRSALSHRAQKMQSAAHAPREAAAAGHIRRCKRAAAEPKSGSLERAARQQRAAHPGAVVDLFGRDSEEEDWLSHSNASAPAAKGEPLACSSAAAGSSCAGGGLPWNAQAPSASSPDATSGWYDSFQRQSTGARLSSDPHPRLRPSAQKLILISEALNIPAGLSREQAVAVALQECKLTAGRSVEHDIETIFQFLRIDPGLIRNYYPS
ncbi:hypothetical protein AB1Y20_000790 [Prymnesium parvum]|uniref:Uncharacterized protein n=1 Tax=Prymnesium parvum TaxID=97485 RepID=A0AB34K5X5_PRYPA